MNRQKTQHQYELYQENIAYLCLMVAQLYFNTNYINNSQVQKHEILHMNEPDSSQSQDQVAQKSQDFDNFDRFEYGFGEQQNASDFDGFNLHQYLQDLQYQDDNSKWVGQNQKTGYWNYEIENDYKYNDISYYDKFDDSQCLKERKKIKTNNIGFLKEPSYAFMIEERNLYLKTQINKALDDNDNISTGNDWECNLLMISKKKLASLNLHKRRKKSEQKQCQAGRGSKKKLQYFDLFSQQLSYLKNKQIKKPLTQIIQQEYLKIGLQFQENNWKVVRKKQISTSLLNPKDKSHKQAISKNESWEVHLKSLRSHFLQNLFCNFGNKLWKVPNQQLIKQYAFGGSNEDEEEKSEQRFQKVSLIQYLEEQRLITNTTYEHFELKRQFYLKAIDMFVFALKLALECDQMADDIIFELLFKVKIGSLF